MKPYRIKHVPTGMYYQPHKYRGSNLSEKGKIYQTGVNGIDTESHKRRGIVTVYVREGSRVHERTKDMIVFRPYEYQQLKADTRYEDWVREEI